MKLFRSIAYIGLLGVASHYIGEDIPRRLFKPEKFPYKSYRWEKNGKIYEHLSIRKWKTRVPDMSKVMTDMLPKRVTAGMTSADIDALIKETCVAEFVHKTLMFLSAGVYFIWDNAVGVVLAAVCVLSNLPFVLIQRYNRPNLIRLRDKLILREERRGL